MKQRTTVKIMMSLAAVAMFVLTPSVCAATAQKPPAKKTSLSESELRTLANAAPDVKNGGKLYSVAMATTNNVERRQEYLKAAAACLIACGKNDVYTKHVKGKLHDVVRFEGELKEDCQQCSGAGTKDRRCYECSGRGQCSRCNGSGQTVHVGFNGQNSVKTCGKCKGDGRCSKCSGEGSNKGKCATCFGTGKVFSTVEAARVFRDSCNAIADNMKFAKESNIAKEDAPRKNVANGVPIVEKGNVTGEIDQGFRDEKASFSESELRTIANAIPNIRYGGKLYSVAMATNNVDWQRKYLKAAAACLIACGNNDIYEKHIKGKLLNAEEFESSLRKRCEQCSGTGTKKRRCNYCNGNGRCPRCKSESGGFGSSRIGTGDFRRNTTCSKCNNNGRCPKCAGDGFKREKCMPCDGTGKVFSKTDAARIFHDSCSAIADDIKDAELEPERRRKREKLRIEREKLRAKMEALGLVDVDGKWMTPGSVRSVRYIVYQIYEPGHALCKDGTGRVFCLLYSADDNLNCSEGDVFVNDLYRCGTYSYISVQNAPRTVAKFAIDLSVALREIEKRNRD